MRVITEENEDLKYNQKPVLKGIDRPEKMSPANRIQEGKKVFIPDSSAFKPKTRGVSPKFYHEQTIKKIDDNKRTGISCFWYMGGGDFNIFIFCSDIQGRRESF